MLKYKVTICLQSGNAIHFKSNYKKWIYLVNRIIYHRNQIIYNKNKSDSINIDIDTIKEIFSAHNLGIDIFNIEAVKVREWWQRWG